MADETLFCRNDLDVVVAQHRLAMLEELDRMSDDRLLNTGIGDLEDYCAQKYGIELPVLGVPQIDTSRTKIIVDRYGGGSGFGRGGGVEVEAQQYTLEVPFSGDKNLFFCRGNTYNSSPPRGSVQGDLLCMTLVDRNPNSDRINQEFDRFIADVTEHLSWLEPITSSWSSRLRVEVREHVAGRRARSQQADDVAGGLKFGLKARSGAAATFSAPISPKRIAPVLPPARPGLSPEPVLTPEAYRDILNTLQQMSEVMERSPHAYAGMDEEALRFQFLVPLNARFEGEARGEVFNYGGKTDILITHRGRNIFIAECKVWSGVAALSAAIDQLLGYLSWRDTKTALLIFNRNKSFSAVLDQIDSTMQAHPNFVAVASRNGPTEFGYIFKQKGDEARQLTLTVLAFDTPAK